MGESDMIVTPNHCMLIWQTEPRPVAVVSSDLVLKGIDMFHPKRVLLRRNILVVQRKRHQLSHDWQGVKGMQSIIITGSSGVSAVRRRTDELIGWPGPSWI